MRKEIIELLKTLVEIDSITSNEKFLGEYLHEFFSKKGFKVYKQEFENNRFNLVVEKGSSDKSIAFYAHLDTVEIVNGWTKEPLKLTIKGNKAFGLGSFDMKGGMVANILTFLNSNPTNYNLKLIFCFDEENISTGAHYLKNEPYVKDIECIISPEPAFKHGITGITTGRIGRSVFEIELNNESRHFMFYEPQQDLNLLSAKIVSSIEKIFKQNNDQKEFVYVRKINSQAKGLSLPENVMIELESSVLAPNTSQTMQQQIQNIIESEVKHFSSSISYTLKLKDRATPFLNGYELAKDDKFLKALSNSVQEVTAKPAVEYFRSSVADDNVFAEQGISVLGIGPVGANAHAPDEWVDLESIEKLVGIFSDFIKNLD